MVAWTAPSTPPPGRGCSTECEQRFPDGLATGAAGWTTGHALPARWVIHVVGPNFNAGDRPRLLVSCYAGALAVADEIGAGSVAFPLVSAGVYGWPLEDAVRAAVDTLRAPRPCGRGAIVAFGGRRTTCCRQVVKWEPGAPADRNPGFGADRCVHHTSGNEPGKGTHEGARWGAALGGFSRPSPASGDGGK